MTSATMVLHQKSSGAYTLHLTLWADGEERRTLLQEESRPMPEVSLSEAWTTAAHMAREALEAVEPGPTLWAPEGDLRSATP